MPPKKKAKSDDAAASSDMFKDLVFFVNGTFTKSQDEIKALIEENGGTTARSLTAKVTHLVTVDGGAKIEDAKAKNIKIVSEQFLHDSIAKKAKQDEASYAVDSKKRAAGDNKDDEDDEPAKKPKRGRKNDAVTATPAPAAAPAAAPAPAAAAAPADEEKKVKVLKKGRAPVDPNARLNLATHRVHEEGDTVWDCMLNQTNIGNNNNKFYVIQLIASDDGKSFYCYNRWGRVGERGQDKNTPFGGNLEGAKSEFKKKFKDKAANNWDDRHKFVPKAGKYTLIEIDYGNDAPEEEKKEVKKDASPKKERPAVESKLDPRVQELIRMIFDMKMMENTLVEMEFDIKKSPLGKLTKKQIKDGYSVLQDMEKVIKGVEKGDLEELTSRFYTLIPHNFGRNRPPVVRSLEQLKTKMQMLDALAEIEIATKILKETEHGSELIAQLDQNYQKLKCAIAPIEKHTDEFKRVANFVEMNQERKPRLELLELFKVDRDGEAARFKKEVGNRKLLWHGSRLTNFAGILSQGLRIAPPEAPASGYRFGKGLYFADIMTLSSNYCRVLPGSPTGLMLLCDTALGKQYECPRDQYMDKAPAGFDSTWALGSVEPDPKGNVALPEGSVLPSGKIVPSKWKSHEVSCREHQLIVYNESLTQMKYLLKIKWHF